MQSLLNEIRAHIRGGRAAEAMARIEDGLTRSSEPERASLLYLRGSLFMKTGDWRRAMNDFMESEAIDADGPAAEARRMLADMWNFYHKDLYNP